MNEFQDNERERFKNLSNQGQVMELFDYIRNLRADIANLKRAILDFQNDLTTYRQIREKAELLNTQEKIEAALNKRFDFWKYFMDKVLPNILTVIVLGILYLVFTKP